MSAVYEGGWFAYQFFSAHTLFVSRFAHVGEVAENKVYSVDDPTAWLCTEWKMFVLTFYSHINIIKNETLEYKITSDALIIK